MNPIFFLLTGLPGLLFLSFSTMEPEPSPLAQDRNWPELARADEPLRIGVVGLVHTHVHWILGREPADDIEIVGIVEPNRDLARRYSARHGFSMDLVFDSLQDMVEAVRPEAVTAFNTIYDHLEVVAFCAPLGIHVMVEKPLAVNLDHARQMAALARRHDIHLLTNYETSWYPSHYEAYRLLHGEKRIGPVRRLVFHHGHPGPGEIGVNEEFLEWLTDPVLNGGGALTDFGCYGANLANWMMQGEPPTSVTCVTQQIKPERYPRVDDEATLLLTYPKALVLIQASWNWSHNRKDMEVYGTTGYLIARDGQRLEVLENEEDGPYALEAEPLPTGRDDPFAYFASVVRGRVKVDAWDVSSLENNLQVMQILEAARKSAGEGRTISWERFVQD